MYQFKRLMITFLRCKENGWQLHFAPEALT